MSVGDNILRDIRRYSEEILRKIDQAGQELNAEMLREVRADTPVGAGTQSGHLKQGWRKKAYGATGRKVASREYSGAVYVVRNVNKPTLTHLLNFPHRIVIHGRDTGRMAAPVMHIPDIRNRYQQRLNEKIERILNNG